MKKSSRSVLKRLFPLLVLSFIVLGIIALIIGCGQKGLEPEEQIPSKQNQFISSLTANPSSLVVGGQAQITTVVVDSMGNPVAGAIVKFTARLNSEQLSITPVDTTDSQGLAQAVLTSGVQTGTVQVTASLGIFTKSLSVDIRSGTGSATFFANPSSIFADGVSTSKLTAIALDATGKPQQGISIQFKTDHGKIEPTSVSTNSKGEAVATLTSEASNTDITATVTATTSQPAGKIQIVNANQRLLARAMNRTDSTDLSRRTSYSGPKSKTEKATEELTVLMKGITINLSLQADRTSIGAKDTIEVYASVKETTSGLPVKGTSVTFQTDLGTFSPNSAVTDESGTVIVKFRSTGIAGSTDLIATTGDKLSSPKVTLQIVKGFGNPTMSIRANPSNIQANGSSTSSITVLLRNPDNTPVEGVPIDFSTTLGTITPGDITNAQGIAIATLTSERANGQAMVTARFQNLVKSTPVIFTGTTLNLSANPLNLIASGTATSTVTAILLDAAGTPIVDEPAELRTDLGTLSKHPGQPGGSILQDTTNVEGKVVAYASSILPGPTRIVATAAGTVDSVRLVFTGYSFELSIIPINDLKISTISTGGIDSARVVAILKQSNGQPVINTPINFSTTLGIIFQRTVFTNSEGKAETFLISGLVSGQAMVTANAEPAPGEPVTISRQIIFTPAPPNQITLTATPNIVKVGGGPIGTAVVLARVTDKGGNPVSNQLVSFRLVKGPGGGETIDPGVTPTDQNGIAQTNFKSGLIASRRESVHILASVGEIVSDTLRLTIAGAPEKVTAGFNPNSFIDNGNGTNSLSVSAIVSDVNGNPVVDGTFVYFGTTPNIGVITSPVQTIAGVATGHLTYPANDAGKEVGITASSNGVLGSVSIRLPGQSGRITSVKSSSTDISILADGLSTTTINAVPSDILGGAVPNAKIEFYVDMGTIEGSALTGGDIRFANYGVASVKYTSAASSKDTTVVITTVPSGNTSVSDSIRIRLRGISLIPSADPPAIFADGQSKSTISVLIKESTSNIPIVEAKVSFGSSMGEITGFSNTNASGVAQATLTSGIEAGTAVITVAYGNVLTAITTVELKGIVATGIELSANPTNILASGTSTSTVRALLKDNSNNPIVGREVRFTTTLGIVTASAVTDESGVAQVVLTSERRDGTAIVTAVFKTLSATIPVKFTGMSLQASANPENLIADNSTFTTISVSVKDAAGIPLVGEKVGASSLIGTFVFTSDITDVDGKATFRLKSSKAGHDTVTISSVGDTTELAINFTGYKFTLSADKDRILTGGDSLTTNAILRDNVGAPIMGAEIIFNTTLGNIESSAKTDANGQASVTMVSGLTAGIATITASASTITGDPLTAILNVALVPAPPASVLLTVDPNIININGGSSTLTAIVTDRNRNPVGGILVSFSILSGPAGGENIVPGTTTTNASGIAVTSFISGSIASSFGGVTMQAKAANVLSAPVSLTIAGAPANVVVGYQVEASTGDIDQKDGTYKLPISAIVSDINGNPVVDGTNVDFGTNSIIAIAPRGIKTEGGKAKTNLTYNASSGGQQITLFASSGGISSSISFALPGIKVSTISLSISRYRLPADGKSTASVAARLFSPYVGQTIPDSTMVTFSTTLGTITPFAPTRGGVATAIFTSGNTAGTSIITASVGGATTEIYLYLDTLDPQYIYLSASTLSIPANGRSFTSIAAQVFDINGQLVGDSTKVTFSTDFGKLFKSATDTIEVSKVLTFNGIATVLLKSGTNPGTATVTAVSGPASGSIHIDFETIEARYISLRRGGYGSVLADGQTLTAIVANVSGLRGNVSDSTKINFTTTLGTLVNSDTVEVKSALTFGGIATVYLQSPLQSGDAIVTAASGSASETISINFIPSVSKIDIEIDKLSLLGNGEDKATISAIVKDLEGRPVGDQIVNFVTTLGTFSLTGPSITDYNGRAIAFLISEPVISDIVVKVYVESKGIKSQSLEVKIRGVEVKITSQFTSIFADGQATSNITVILREATSKVPIPSQTVFFGTDLGTIRGTAITDEFGVATSLLKSDVEPGTAHVRVSYGTVPAVTISVIFSQSLIKGPPASIALVSTSTNNIGVKGSGSDESSTLLFEVRDGQGYPVGDNLKVVFTLAGGPGGGEAVSPAFANTVAGQVKATVTSGTKSGTVKVVATTADTISSGAITITIYGGPPHKDHFTVVPELKNIHGLVTMGLTDKIKVYVFDEFYNPVPSGTAVYFSTTGGGIGASSLTDITGFASTTLYSANPLPVGGMVTVIARTLDKGGNTISTTTQVLFSGPTDAIQVTPSTFAVPRGGFKTFIYQVSDTFGNPLTSGTTITVQSTLGTLSGNTSVTLGDNLLPGPGSTEFGFSLSSAKEDTVAQAATVTINVISLNGSTATTINGTIGGTSSIFMPTVSKIDIEVNKLSLLGNGEEKTVVTAIVKDPDGRPVEGQIVNFVTSLGTFSLTGLPVTDQSGRVTAILVSAPVTSDIVAKVYAESKGIKSQSLDVNFRGVEVTVSSQFTSIFADGKATSNITVILREATSKVPITGQVIQFGTDLGTIKGVSTTDDLGVATSTLNAGTDPGTAHVRVSYGPSLSTTVSVIFSRSLIKGPPASIALISTSTNNIGVKGSGSDEASTLMFEVRDGQGYPAGDDLKVYFSLTGGPGGGEAVFPSFDYTVAGQVKATVTSGTKAGTVKIVATTADTISSGAITITIHGGPPHKDHFTVAPEIRNIHGLVPEIGIGLTDKIKAYVFDEFYNPVPAGTAVYFSSSGGGIGASSLTDSTGFASTTLYTANPLPTGAAAGLVTVTARTLDKGGDMISTTTQVLFSGPTDAIEVSPTRFAVPQGGSKKFTYSVRDTYGNPLVAGTTITVTSKLGTLAGNIAVTLGDSKDPGPGSTEFGFSLSAAKEDTVDQATTIIIEVKSPNGAGTATIDGTVGGKLSYPKILFTKQENSVLEQREKRRR